MMMAMRRYTLALPLLAILPGFAQTAKEEMVPMRDGVRLATSIYLPEGNGPWPVVLTRTPYGKDMMYGPATHKPYLERGYARVVQDVARQVQIAKASTPPSPNDMEDGYDTIEWIAKQPWSNGKVGMVGPSAMGIATDLAAMTAPPHLVTGFVNVASGTRFQHTELSGRRFPAESQRRVAAPPGSPSARRSATDHPHLRRRSAHAGHAPVLRKHQHSDVQRRRVVRHFSRGNIDAFMGSQDHGGPEARGNQKLMMGAFGHGALKGDLKYPADAGNLNGGDTLRWFDYWMKGIDNGIMKEPAVRYYMMGDTFDKSAPGNQWRTAASWPPAATATSYYLTAAHALSTAKPSGHASLSYVSDPKNPIPAIGGNNLMMDRGPMDQRKVSSRADVLKFETEPLKQAVEIAGPLSAEPARCRPTPKTRTSSSSWWTCIPTGMKRW